MIRPWGFFPRRMSFEILSCLSLYADDILSLPSCLIPNRLYRVTLSNLEFVLIELIYHIYYSGSAHLTVVCIPQKIAR